MSVRALVGVIRFTAAICLELDRAARRYFAEYIDRAEENR